MWSLSVRTERMIMAGYTPKLAQDAASEASWVFREMRGKRKKMKLGGRIMRERRVWQINNGG